jgi:hypothetical protein
MLCAAPLVASECETVVLGDGVSLTEMTPIAELLDQAPERVGERVAVAGEVEAVCQMMGCWLEVEATEGAASIRVKVDDGVIVFPQWAKGKAARAEGTVEKLELSRADYIKQKQHEAEEGGAEFDETALEGDGPFDVYRIRGTGAEICR